MENKKIKNSKKAVHNWIKFDSWLELYAYKRFIQESISFEVKKKFTIQEWFGFQWDKIRPIEMIPDYIVWNCIVETKWYPNDSYPMKLKMLKKHIVDQSLWYDIQILKNQKQIDQFIINLKTWQWLDKNLRQCSKKGKSKKKLW